jgi:hypothetical protein
VGPRGEDEGPVPPERLRDGRGAAAGALSVEREVGVNGEGLRPGSEVLGQRPDVDGVPGEGEVRRRPVAPGRRGAGAGDEGQEEIGEKCRGHFRKRMWWVAESLS